jgi:hypothetical protein
VRGALQILAWAVTHPLRAAGYVWQIGRLVWAYGASGEQLDVQMYDGRKQALRRRVGFPGVPVVSRLRQVVAEVLEQACEFGGGWNRETFDAKVEALLAAATARDLVKAVDLEQRRGALLAGFEVAGVWRNDGCASLHMECTRCDPSWWHEWDAIGRTDTTVPLHEIVESAQLHYREVHAS